VSTHAHSKIVKPNKADDWTVPVVLPVQRSSGPQRARGEQLLMANLLWGAFEDIRVAIESPHLREWRQHGEAAFKWVCHRSVTKAYLYSFDNVCDVLAVSGSRLREITRETWDERDVRRAQLLSKYAQGVERGIRGGR